MKIRKNYYVESVKVWSEKKGRNKPPLLFYLFN